MMSEIDQKMIETTGEKVNFKDRLQKTRVKKSSITPRDDNSSSSRS